MSRDFELPVDVPKKSEIVQQRIFTLIVFGCFAAAIFIIFLFSISLGLFLAKGMQTLPDVKILSSYHPKQSTRIYDIHDELIANIHGDEDRVSIPLSKTSKNLQYAVMAIEDNRFHQHNGVDIRGTLRAVAANAKGSDVQGGSTITQQLVKNLFLSPERSYTRKLAEAILALRIEKHYSKDKIMEIYLNQIYWGNRAYGIQKAAKRYYGINAKDLTIGQSALLAAQLSSPARYSPYAHPEAARKRQLEVIRKMVKYGYITEEQRKEALKETVTLRHLKPKPSKFPFFIAHVIQELNKKYGKETVRRGGLRVYTTIDPAVQLIAEKAVKNKVRGFSAGSKVTNGALIAIDVPSSQIIALVGGVDFNKSQFNLATQARRAAGSQFKPFVYLTGFRLGVISPSSPISDKPVRIGNWRPKNWDHRYIGPMTIRRALTLSRNTTTVQVGMRVGIDEVIKTARMAGFDGKIDRNLSSLLGSSGTSPLTMANAFTTFARGGVQRNATAIRQVKDVTGRFLALKNERPKRTLDPNAIAQLNSILVDVVEKGTGKKARIKGRQVAGKTGTTDKNRDVWFTGYTSDMVATVWMGNERYVPLRGVHSYHAAEVWRSFAAPYYEHKKSAPASFTRASNHKQARRNAVVVYLSPPKAKKKDLTSKAPQLPLLQTDPNAKPNDLTITPEKQYNTFSDTSKPVYDGKKPTAPTTVQPTLPQGDMIGPKAPATAVQPPETTNTQKAPATAVQPPETTNTQKPPAATPKPKPKTPEPAAGPPIPSAPIPGQ